MVCDHYYEKWYPYTHPWQVVPPPIQPIQPAIPQTDIEEFRKLLERAREYDKRTGQPDCDLEEKRQRVKKLAQDLGVEISFL